MAQGDPMASNEDQGILTRESPTPDALISVTITNDWETLFHLEKPTNKFDEPSFGGFNYMISGTQGDFFESDIYLNIGDETTPEHALGLDLGGPETLSGRAYDFRITHVAGLHYIFSMTPLSDGESGILCWGQSCPAGAISAERLGSFGFSALGAYNGIQLQLRAQEVEGASAHLSHLTLTGLDISADSVALLDARVRPDTPSTIPVDPPGRIGQWILGIGLSRSNWSLSGRVTLTRPDDAVMERTKVRLAVDFVRDTRLD